jgi:hypothetical protein
MFGTLSEFTLTHLLQLFALSEKMGSITVHAGSLHTCLLIESDRVVGIGASDFNVRSELMKLDLLPSESLTALAALDPREDTPGLSIISGNLVDPSRWDLYVARRFEQDVYPLLNEDEGTFEISVDRSLPAPMRVSATIQQLILDGSRWEAESDALRADGYYLDRMWQRATEDPPASDVILGHDGWLVWSALRNRSTISDAAHRLGVPELVAAAAVKQLHEHGRLRRVP